ncbi:hypothetical protein LIER_42004 [Lithospermum erythrorhizon]|uniref:MULE transposase domain-containing protein n=1 Tax=Lithospermum erythrorhizon TaxID=34254 RepID=A0AAV3RHU9_LITER
MKTIYNIRQQLKHEMMEDRTVLQQFVKVLGDTGYKYELRIEVVTNVVSDVLFVHPDSLKLLHAFPYILIMDSTYNTNRYKVPLFEIFGITSTGNSFVAAYAFLSSEQEKIYTWVLDMLRKHMIKQLPTVILTDREMALINAIDIIFPSTFHMLCRWHIEKDVEAMVLKQTQNKDLATSFKFSWKRLLNSQSATDYEKS